MGWLNANSGAIISVIGLLAFLLLLVLVGLVGWYTYLTREVFKTTNRPELAVYLQFYMEKVNAVHDVWITELCVKNVGFGIARKLRFNGDFCFQPENGLALENIYFIQTGIDNLLPGQEIYGVVSSQENPYFHNYDQNASIEIDVIYEDTKGFAYQDSFTLDFNYLNHPQYSSLA